MQIHCVPAFSDNYIWLIENQDQQAAVVDPGESSPVIERLKALGLDLTVILITHKHYDHINGVNDLLASFPNAKVYGPGSIPVVQIPLEDKQNQMIEGFGEFNVMPVPGHTLEHIAYFLPELKAAFVGDTLFAGGCGRMFEGTQEQMQASLAKLAQLPADTKIYCAHEYTLANLAFCRHVDPGNLQLKQRESQAKLKRAEGEPTVPSLLEEELATNVFLRWDQQEIQHAVIAHESSLPKELSPAEVFGALRGWKDNF